MDDLSFTSNLNQRLMVILDNQAKLAPAKDSQLLINNIKRVISRGGKRFRPILFYLTFSAYGGRDYSKILDLAAAIEFHHQFLLVHDDLIDNDTVRYDGPNIIGLYERIHKNSSVAKAMGLIAGDWLESLVNKLIVEDKFTSAQQKLELLSLLQATSFQTLYGEQLDSLNNGSYKFSLEKLSFVSNLKTASYSTKLPMQAAAAMRHLDSDEKSKIDNFARLFGITFQLVDDYNDYFSNEFRDYQQAKLTQPLYLGLTLAKPIKVKFLKSNFGNEVPDAELQEVKEVLEECGAKAAAEQYINKQRQKLNQSLSKLAISTQSGQRFSALIDRYLIVT